MKAPNGNEKVLDSATFKTRILFYMIGKTALAAVSAILVKIVIPENPLSEAVIMHEEARALGLLTQVKLLMTDSTYILFVYGPLISVSLIGGSDNHLQTMLGSFLFTPVKILLILT